MESTATSVIPPAGVDAAEEFEVFAMAIWAAGLRTRGQVAYGEPDIPAES